MIVSPIQLHAYLRGVQYPTSKESLIETAEVNGASEEVLDVLDVLPSGEYYGLVDLIEEIEDLEAEEDDDTW